MRRFRVRRVENVRFCKAFARHDGAELRHQEGFDNVQLFGRDRNHAGEVVHDALGLFRSAAAATAPALAHGAVMIDFRPE